MKLAEYIIIDEIENIGHYGHLKIKAIRPLAIPVYISGNVFEFTDDALDINAYASSVNDLRQRVIEDICHGFWNWTLCDANEDTVIGIEYLRWFELIEWDDLE